MHASGSIETRIEAAGNRPRRRLVGLGDSPERGAGVPTATDSLDQIAAVADSREPATLIATIGGPWQNSWSIHQVSRPSAAGVGRGDNFGLRCQAVLTSSVLPQCDERARGR
jgi:hypothetical protein